MTNSSKKRRRGDQLNRKKQVLEQARSISLVDSASPVPATDSFVDQKRARLSLHNPEDSTSHRNELNPSTVDLPNPLLQNQPKEPSWKRVDFVLPRACGKKQFTFDRQTKLKQDISSASLQENGVESRQMAKESKKSETIENILFAGKQRKKRDTSSDQRKDIRIDSRFSDQKDVISQSQRRKLGDSFEAIHQEIINPIIVNLAVGGKSKEKDNQICPRTDIIPTSHNESTLPENNVKVKASRDNMVPKARKDHSKKQEVSRNNIMQHPSSGQITGRSVEEAVRDKRGLRPRANSTDGELNLPQGGLCDERMVLEAHKWNMEKKYVNQIPPRGFHNLGNTCFLNATLQCLAYLPPLFQTLIAISMDKKSNRQNGGMKKWHQGQRMTSSLCSLFQQAHGSNGSSKQGCAIAPKSIANALPIIGSCGSRNGHKFRLGRQEDAHEFLVHLLDAMNDGELRGAGINQHVSGWRDRLPVSRLDETTFIHRIFGGYFRSQVRCRKCNYRSNTYDPFLDLSLEVSKESSSSLLKALSEFTRKETLDAANQWKCSGCMKYVCATKQLTVFRPPLSICIQLKRFAFKSGGQGMNGYKFSKSHHGGGCGGSKITKPIQFPGILNLPLSDSRSCQYTLTGVVIHVGKSSHSGHYTAYVKKPETKGTSQWYHMDDSYVQPVSEKTVLKQKDAYLLFYCRAEVKLEFPAPPMRSMSASEATELRRARARARADSFSTDNGKEEHKKVTNNHTEMEQEMIEVQAKSLIKQHALNSQEDSSACGKKEPNNGVERVKTKIHPLSNPHTLRQYSKHEIVSPANVSVCTTKQDENEDYSSSSSPSSSSSDRSRSRKLVSNSDRNDSDNKTSKKRKEKCSDMKTNGYGVKVSLEKESSSDSSVSSSGDGSSESNDSSNDDESDSSSSSSSSKEDAPDDSSEVAKVNSIPYNLKSSVTKQENNSRNSSKIEADSETKGTPINEGKIRQHARQIATNKTNNKTKVVLSKSDSRGKVKVMLGPRKRKFWGSKATALPSNESNFQLLGNMGVSRWDDDENDDDEKNSNRSNKSGVYRDREHIVKKIVKQDRSRKRKMHLDRWDSLLDQGKMKKVKEVPKTPTYPSTSRGPKDNIFQMIQSGVQKMNRGKPKGQFRRKSINNNINKKRKH
mmetsp:Transcript_4357/g.4940  ORF Transcript_4357/g.4940 Transcript_4357/m.4940 type:complete len:1146 (+) Transcript_4357:22-3459(+)